jgi:drug/metabolite transporter (DMT)-like permease
MSNFASVGLGLSTSAAWGTSNFLGGYASHRSNPFLLSTISDLLGLAFLALIVATVHEPLPSKHALIWALIAGGTGGVALATLYGSLASGRMGLASPVVGVISVTIPAIVTLVREGSPGTLRLIGFALAILGISLISRTEDKTDRKAIALAVLAGCGFAAYSLAIKEAGPASAMWIEIHSRLAAILITGLITICGRKLRDFHRRAAGWAAAAGLLDVSGSVAFVRATQVGRLDVAVVLSSLYPAVTVLLAIIVLKEKLTLWKSIGICAAITALPLIVL